MQGKPGNKDIVIGVCFIMYGIAAEVSVAFLFATDFFVTNV